MEHQTIHYDGQIILKLAPDNPEIQINGHRAKMTERCKEGLKDMCRALNESHGTFEMVADADYVVGKVDFEFEAKSNIKKHPSPLGTPSLSRT